MMKSWKLPLLFLLLLASCLIRTQAQPDNCYEDLRSSGLKYMADRQNADYGMAINQFWAAFTCRDLPENNDLNELIRRAQQEWVQSLNQTIDLAKKAEREANEARGREEDARAREQAARYEAEANAAEAREKGIIAESLRLSLLSDKVRQEGSLTDALLLSFIGLQLANPDTFHNAWRSFAEAVMDSLATPLFKTEAPCSWAKLLPNGGYLALSTPGQVVFLNLNDGGATPVRTAASQPPQLAASPDGQHFLTWADSPEAQLWDARGQLIGGLEGHTEPVRVAALFGDGPYVASGGRDDVCIIYDAQGQALATLQGHEGNIYELHYAPQTQLLLTRSSDGTAGIWSLDGQQKARIDTGEPYLYAAAFSPDGKKVLTAGASGAVRSWSVSGTLTTDYKGLSGPAKEARVLPEGRGVIGRSLKEARIWNIDGNPRATLNHQGDLSGFQLSKKRQLILTWGDDGFAKLWDANGRLLHTFIGHQAPLIQAAFSPDEQLILTTARDGTAKIWDLAGNIILDWAFQSSQPLPSFFSPDGKYFISVIENNNTILRCPLPQAVYQEMTANPDGYKEDLARLQKKYDIQYTEEMMEARW